MYSVMLLDTVHIRGKIFFRDDTISYSTDMDPTLVSVHKESTNVSLDSQRLHSSSNKRPREIGFRQ
jgi:hypothetical protein